MDVKVVSEKDISFAFFLRSVLKMKDWPWTKRGILEEFLPEIPEQRPSLEIRASMGDIVRLQEG